MNIEKYIRDISKEIGIDIIGFTSSSPLNVKRFILEKRNSGKYTEFEEKDIEKRIDPKLTMENCKSIIIIGVSYNMDFKPKKSYDLNGNISMSSWGTDYHKVLKTKLESLIEKIKEKRDFEYKSFVDTGPLVDRELAKRAGIGFYGKNCSIINKDYGSFIFLGYILTDIEITPDNPLEDGCGDCDLCLRACPTGALESSYDLNPKKCISYLTQTKETISRELRKKMGTKIYGCDTCQRVCPKNKGVKLSSHEEFIPTITGGVMDLEKLLFMSNKEFKREFGSMAGSWRGKNILKRNAIIAIGNIGDEKNIPLLLEVKKDSNLLLEEYIDWAIENILTNSKQSK
ncbi:tRNA epoxyqueuosine(34) reductase QueG [Tissierella creatinophila]|uniref:Epoxyqueuosine reductase n=1 Tax=Tissierella creatinophila DSM 6911 TaxID=1123403 RepID=A0A1U7M970_TISCR|nr:tRNA epoxyqueuosine(34) reductase QueG [Tissierella creatinophila]OLS03862.1 epoxyqueuosine reductase [Tissierella creatinophila DSM 6911]